MKSSSHAEGFTIVETLIVLAVTGALFIGAAMLISGRQSSTQFQQGARDIESRVQKTLNEVASGYYPSNGNFECDGTPGFPRLTTGSKEQGTNEDCIFLGKVMQFAVAGTDPEAYHVYSLVGLRKNTTGATDPLVDAKPTILAPSTINPTAPNGLFDKETMPFGLSVSKAYIGTDTAGNRIGAIGFVTRIKAGSNKDSSQQVDLVAIRGTGLNQSQTAGVNTINTRFNPATIPAGDINPVGGVFVCLSGSDPKRSALVTIGGSGRQLSVAVNIKETSDCT